MVESSEIIGTRKNGGQAGAGLNFQRDTKGDRGNPTSEGKKGINGKRKMKAFNSMVQALVRYSMDEEGPFRKLYDFR